MIALYYDICPSAKDCDNVPLLLELNEIENEEDDEEDSPEVTPKPVKKLRRVRLKDPDFAAPDGGWGWLVVFACGFSNLSTLPMMQQFGLVFREKFEQTKITSAQTTTIINLSAAFTSCVGLLNGPLMRSFSYRQVGFFGALTVWLSLTILVFCDSFYTYIIFFSICFGSGLGITQSANVIALNTYFKERRRIATGLSWSVTALGPVLWPYIITVLMDIFGMTGTLMIFAAFASHAIACSLLLQPVHWHTHFREAESIDPDHKDIDELDCKYQVKTNGSSTETEKDTCEDDSHKEKDSLLQICKLKDNVKTEERESFRNKIYKFFDLDLLKDRVYVNLMLGINVAVFVEANFSTLTPFVLEEFKFQNNEIATFMSLLAVTDIIVRLTIPFCANLVSWNNKTFFLIGVLTMAFGRIVLVHTQSYNVSIIVAVIIGFGKGLRTVFMSLIIPSHVSIERLPGATGLQLASAGILCLSLGPIVGWLRDLTNSYVITLHILNILTYLTAAAWTIDKLLENRRKA